ncbi:MAG: EboA domain-containing protein [Nocardioides sp.]|uniref:EboA domain-containing protein n=1 Tax=Nocardioides sp. TaxID=35761 RepID=UPI0032651DA3
MTTPLTPASGALLQARIEQVRRDPASIRTVFPALAREVAREDGVRVAVLEALGETLAADGPRLLAEVRDLYRHGDADERRSVLLALHRLPVGDDARDLVDDGLRTNDTRLVAAALGPYGARVLDDASWRQAVLKCLFTGVPLSAVHALDDRVDADLIAMVSAFADERTAAGREIPADARTLLDRNVPQES